MEAEVLAETCAPVACDTLWKEIEETEQILMRATARLRLAVRPQSVTGNGEHRDRLNDTIARITLSNERALGDFHPPDAGCHLHIVDDDDGDADFEWDAFVQAHPLEDGDPDDDEDDDYERQSARWAKWEQARRERDADRARLRRLRAESQPLVDAIDFSTERVLEALRQATADKPGGVHVAAIARLLVPPDSPITADYDTNAWRRVIARVVRALRVGLAEGTVTRRRPSGSRETYLWAVATSA